jgi:hypothetical protein
MLQSRESDHLLRLLHSTEHTFVERKTTGDHKDWVKIVVSFANSLQVDQEGVLFIGATDEGEIEPHSTNLERLQRTFSDKMQNIYPPVYVTTASVQENGRECLAVIVAGSSSRPHFAGPPYLRDGAKSIVPNSEQYESLLASRLGKVYEIQRWIDKPITIRTFKRREGMGHAVDQSTDEATVIFANQFYLTVSYSNNKGRWSFPLNRFEICYDHQKDRLEIELLQPQV